MKINIVSEAAMNVREYTLVSETKLQELAHHRKQAMASMDSELGLWNGVSIVDGAKVRHHLRMMGMILDEIQNDEGPTAATDDPSSNLGNTSSFFQYQRTDAESQAALIVPDFLRPEFYRNNGNGSSREKS